MQPPTSYISPEMVQLPPILLVNFSRVYFICDRLNTHDEFPPIDTEALLSAAVDQMRTQSTPENWKEKLDALMRVSCEHAHSAGDDGYDYVTLRKHLYQILLRAEQAFLLNQLYISGKFPYDYVQRRKSGIAQLRHSPLAV